MFCPNCGYNNKDGNKFCLKCGKEFVPQKQTRTQQNTNYDPKAEEEKSKNEALEYAVKTMSSGTLKDYENAAEILRKLQGWKNADELKKQCEDKIAELQQERIVLKKKRIKLAAFISAPITVLLVIAVIVGILITPKLKYGKATEFLDNADYTNASAIFEEIRDYNDSETALKYISVMNGDITDYDEKVNILESLGDYRNSAEVLLDLKYEKACEYADNENYREAVELLDSLDGHDPDNVKNGIYTTAVGYFDDRKFAQAAEIFLILGKYEDSEEYVEKVYNQAETYQKDKKFHYAAAVYMALGSYKDSKDKVEELYKKCLDFIEKEKYTDAIPVLKNLKDYKESESKLEEIYNKAVQLVEDKKYDKAEKIFEKFGKYKQSEEKLNEISELKNKEKYDKAVKLGEDEKYDEAIKLFEELGDYSDSKDKISEIKNLKKNSKYDRAISLMEQNELYAALEEFEALGDYKDSKAKIAEIEEKIEIIQNLRGNWVQTSFEISFPYFMEITDLGNDYFYAEVHLDGDNFTWTFSGKYNYRTNMINYSDGTYITKYAGTSIVQDTDLSGTLEYSDGYLYWTSNIGKVIEFERN
ncbi:MAG: zinc-ribbon domain-containing protein [Clostridium sp.]|nr:zinc-ribbon domain-containing protein [Clostridium sp.]